ncbi:MAG TPA: AfsR/SARP family transcriptional regulator, partial [Micromonosporaceae bacterium]
MQIAMLGPLDVRTDADGPCAISGVRLARLLSVLALQPGRVVSTAAIVDAVWGEAPPAEPGNAVQALVSRLRRAAPGLAIMSRAQGYLLDIEPDAVDVIRFERLLRPPRTADSLRQALDLWRGPALADAGDAEFAASARARLDELRLTALQDRIAADLRSGPPGPLVAELEGLVAAYPLREPLIRLLMRALHAAGDRGRALTAYDEARKRFADELGIAPSAELAAEHLTVLRADAEIRTDTAGTNPVDIASTNRTSGAANAAASAGTVSAGGAAHRTDITGSTPPAVDGGGLRGAASDGTDEAVDAASSGVAYRAVAADGSGSASGTAAMGGFDALGGAALGGDGADGGEASGGAANGAADADPNAAASGVAVDAAAAPAGAAHHGRPRAASWADGAAEPIGGVAGLTNLRTEISSFVGRDADIAEVDSMLSRYRLITLIGPGGAGKTR